MTAVVGVTDPTVPYSVALANTNTTAVYTVPTSRVAKGIAVFVGNGNASTVIVQLFRYDASATTEYMIYGQPLATTLGYVLDLQGIRLDSADEIRAKGNSSVAVTVVVSEQN